MLLFIIFAVVFIMVIFVLKKTNIRDLYKNLIVAGVVIFGIAGIFMIAEYNYNQMYSAAQEYCYKKNNNKEITVVSYNKYSMSRRRVSSSNNSNLHIIFKCKIENNNADNKNKKTDNKEQNKEIENNQQKIRYTLRTKVYTEIK